MATSVRIAVVGDVHDFWSPQEDARALHFLRPDLVLFTGDFGDGKVELVRSIANLDMAKAVILGNHDSFIRQNSAGKLKDAVQIQLDCLGEEHVGYRRLDFPTLKLSVVGGRPFSHGGEQLFQKRLLAARYGVHNMKESANKIFEAAIGMPEDHSIILLAHNGPTGLGSDIDDICGKDWDFGGGDHGDPDLAQALSHLKVVTNFSIPLVVFGHMHKELAYGNGLRKMMVTGADGTIYLNGAIVPRVKIVDEKETKLSAPLRHSACTIRAFTLVEILDGRLGRIAETWVSVIGDEATLEEERILYKCSTE